MNKKKLVIASVSSILISVAALGIFIVAKNKSSNKKSVDIWHKVVITSNKVGDFSSTSPSDANNSKLVESVIELNSVVDDAKFNTSKLSYFIKGSERKQKMESSLTKLKDYNSKLKSSLDTASSNPDELTSSQINELTKISEELKKEVQDMADQIKFNEKLSDNYYLAYQYPESLSKKLADAKKAEDSKTKAEQELEKQTEQALNSSKDVVDDFLAAYTRKDFAAMKSNMTSGFQNEFKFKEIEAGWDNSHPKSYRVIESKKDGDSYLVSVNITYFGSYTDSSGKVTESENTSSQKYRVSQSGGAWLVDGEVYGY